LPEGAFDIYQTEGGYAAVTNPIQRQILEALRIRERQLPELVELTGRSKPTLSSLHMKELLARGLIQEAAHPTDSRRKVYRLKGAKIGSSDLPVEQLRDAVQHYVTLSPLANRIPVAAAFEAIAAAPPSVAPDAIHAQSARLGALAAPLFKAATARDLWMRLAAFLEGEKLATPLRIDLQKGAIELRLGPAATQPAARLAAVFAGFAQGVATGKALGMTAIRGTATPDGVKLWAE
jgi:hypothetical protein